MAKRKLPPALRENAEKLKRGESLKSGKGKKQTKKSGRKSK